MIETLGTARTTRRAHDTWAAAACVSGVQMKNVTNVTIHTTKTEPNIIKERRNARSNRRITQDIAER